MLKVMHFLILNLNVKDIYITFIGAVVKNIKCVHCFFSSLLVTEDQVDPFMEATGHMITLLGSNTDDDDRALGQCMFLKFACRC